MPKLSGLGVVPASPRTVTRASASVHGTVSVVIQTSHSSRASPSGGTLLRRHLRGSAVHAAAPSAGPEPTTNSVDGDWDDEEDVIEAEEPPSFASMGVDKLFLAGLSKMGIHDASDIQAAAIPPILAGKNVAMQSYTGSGKTLAFLLPAMTRMTQQAEALYKSGAREVPLQLLVVAPSQELAMQIVRVAQGLLPDQHRRLVQQCIGGANPHRQEEGLLANKPLMVVGTPGRVAEFVRIAVLRLHQCPMLILDEADQLLAPAFSEDMAHISNHCGKRLQDTQRQTVLVSATLSEAILARTERWCPSPTFVTPEHATAPTVAQRAAAAATTAAGASDAASPAWGWGAKGWDGPAARLTGPRTAGAAGGVEAGLVPTMPPQLGHYYCVVDVRHKADCLRRVVHALGAERVLVFMNYQVQLGTERELVVMNYQDRLKDVVFKLKARGMAAAALHGEMSKLARANVLNDFRRGRARVLVVSDVVSRGLDVSACDAVVNLEMPSNAAHYAHRAGRTGRMGATGAVVTIAGKREAFVVQKLSQTMGVPILESHVARGELVLGPTPAPATTAVRNDRDISRDATTSPSPSPSPSQQQQQQQRSDEAAGLSAGPMARRAGADSALDVADDADSDDEDDVGDVDVRALERRLRADKAMAGTQSPSARAQAARRGSSGGTGGGGSVRDEMRRELEELRGERRARRAERRRGSGSGSGRAGRGRSGSAGGNR